MVKMSKIYVVFWTQGGNTQAMAQAVGEGITAAGKEAEVIYVGGIKAEDLKEEAVFAMGCPAMGQRCLKKGKWNPLYQRWKPLRRERRSVFSAPMDGETASG